MATKWGTVELSVSEGHGGGDMPTSTERFFSFRHSAYQDPTCRLSNQALETNCAKFGLAMLSLMQSMLIVMVGLGLLAPANNFAQSPRPSPNANMVLEVIATHTTMASEDRYVYLRVFSDSTAECQPSKHSNSQKTLLVVKRTLTQDEFIRIKSVVSESKLAAVKPKYETRYAIVDTWTRVDNQDSAHGTTTNHSSPRIFSGFGENDEASVSRRIG